jgi:hypothetical protein
MIAHFLNNFVILILEYLKINVNLANPILIVLGALSLVIFVTLCKNGIKSLTKKEQAQGGVKAFCLPFGLFGTCVCVVLMLSVLF